MIVSQKDDDILAAFSSIENRNSQHKLEHIRNFVEYRCKRPSEREAFKSSVLKRQQAVKQRMFAQISEINSATSQFTQFKRKPGKCEMIKIEGDEGEPSLTSQESIHVKRHRDLEETEFSFLFAEDGGIYEQMVQKLESDIRSHIRVENQLKLIIESAQTRIDECERKIKKDHENFEEKLKEKEQKINELEDNIKNLQIKPKPLTINFTPHQTGHTGSIISGYSGQISDSNNIQSSSKHNDKTPISEFEPCLVRRTSLPVNNQKQMLPIRERKRSITARESNQNSLTRQSDNTQNKFTDQNSMPRFLNSMATERNGIQRNISALNKYFFKITDNSDKNMTRSKDNLFYSNSNQISKEAQGEVKHNISRKLIKNFLMSRKNDSEFQQLLEDRKDEDNNPKNMVKLLNFECDNIATSTPATCLKFNQTIKKKSRPNSRKKQKNLKEYKESQGLKTIQYLTKTTTTNKHGSNERKTSKVKDDATPQLEILKRAQELLLKPSRNASPVDHKVACWTKKSPKMLSKTGKSIKKSSSAASKSPRKGSKERKRKMSSPYRN